MASCTEKVGNKVESSIASKFSSLGKLVGTHPKKAILFAILLTACTGAGFIRWTTENRQEKLWVPQNTDAEKETERYEGHFDSASRLNLVIVQANQDGDNVLTKERLIDAMKMHTKIATEVAKVDGKEYTFENDLCLPGGGVCKDAFLASTSPICSCAIFGVLKQWNYDLSTLEADNDVLATINAAYPTKEELEATFGNPSLDSNDKLISAEAFTISYLIVDRTEEAGSDEKGSEDDPINEGWEEDVFLKTTRSVSKEYPTLSVDYLAGRSFGDEFGGAISGDILLVQVSYFVIFFFLGLTLGNIRMGPGSRYTLSLGALILVGLSTGACFGLSSAFGLFYGPVHSLLPFILLGIGVDDAFVVVNAYNRERKVARSAEDNETIAMRSARALARAGSSITVTSLTDLVAFGISASSSLPALASFCGYAAVGVVFLWLFSATFFAACTVLDERRQRDNRREYLCCQVRKKPLEETGEDQEFQEMAIARYFRNYHAPAILSKIGKILILILFSTTLGFGIYGAINLSVENTERSFVPPDSYLSDFLKAIDDFYPSTGVEVMIVVEDGAEIFDKKESLSTLDDRLSGLSTAAPYIAEPNQGQSAYRNVMTGYADFLASSSSAWPSTKEELTTALRNFIFTEAAGQDYIQDISFSEDGSEIDAIRISTSLVSLTKTKRNGNIIDDADKQIEAMDEYRNKIEMWINDGIVPQTTFLYSERFIGVEGFKIIRRELFLNVGLALAAVAVIVLVTVASPVTAALITVNVSACIIEILGAMYYLGIAIDSVSVINIVLAVGLSIDYSAHVGHCFMMKGGDDKNRRSLEALADIGSAVLSGATSTFLAVVVLLFSKSYVFKILSQQFALTVVLGSLHGLVLLPVLLSLLGPKSFDSAEEFPDENSSSKDTGDEKSEEESVENKA